MNALWPILGMGLAVFALRLGGLMLPDATVPLAWEQALGFVPVAVLSALIVTGLAGKNGGGMPALVAVAGAALVVRCTGQMWACIVSGMALYWLVRLI